MLGGPRCAIHARWRRDTDDAAKDFLAAVNFIQRQRVSAKTGNVAAVARERRHNIASQGMPVFAAGNVPEVHHAAVVGGGERRPVG